MPVKKERFQSKTRLVLRGFVLLLLAAFLSTPLLAAERLVIGTGSKKGVYFQVGRLLCLTVRDQRRVLKCKYKATKGSSKNLPDLRRGKFDVIVANSLWGEWAYKGQGPLKPAGPDTNLRALFSFHPEPITIIARRDSGIRQLNDLKGKRLAVGRPVSRGGQIFSRLMAGMGWRYSDFEFLSKRPALTPEQQGALCENRVDALVFSVGFPSPFTAKTLKKCDSIIVPLSGSRVDRMVRSAKYLRKATIPGGLYKTMPNATKTFGTGAVLYTRADVSEQAIYTLVKGVFEHLDRIRQTGGPFANLKVSEMIHDSVNVPLHAGALRYYREQGWMK